MDRGGGGIDRCPSTVANNAEATAAHVVFGLCRESERERRYRESWQLLGEARFLR